MVWDDGTGRWTPLDLESDGSGDPCTADNDGNGTWSRSASAVPGTLTYFVQAVDCRGARWSSAPGFAWKSSSRG